MSGVRVLIAEDDPIFRDALAALVNGDPSLELAGVAEDADEAIEIARVQRPNVALVDVRMPGGGGPRATRGISALSSETKVLALSAADDRDAVFGMLRAGAIGYLVKDVSPENLSRSIAQASKGQAILSRRVTAAVIEELVLLLDRSEAFTEELQALTRTKSELVQILSHELRTPVTVIQGAISMLGKPALSLSAKDFAEISATAMRASAKLARLAGNVSAAASLGPENSRISTRPLLVNDLLSRASTEFPSQGHSLNLLTDEHAASASISANFDLATRAVVLVMENALELSPKGQAVEVRAKSLPGKVEIHVSDRGPGIPEESRKHIFEPFTQVDSSSTRTHQGIGMGLYLARRIMEVHGGALDFLSRTGGGSTFVLTFLANSST